MQTINEQDVLVEDKIQSLLITHHRPEDIKIAISVLRKNKILTLENIDLLAAHSNPVDLAFGLSELHHSKLFTPEYQTLLSAHARPSNLFLALTHLDQASMLYTVNLEVFISQPKAYELARSLVILQQAALFNQNIVSLLVTHSHPHHMAYILQTLNDAEQLTETNFAALFLPNHLALLSPEAINQVWARIPIELLTQANYQRLIIASEAPNPLIALQEVTNQILGVIAAETVDTRTQTAEHFNPQQSTHTASIHRSVTDSLDRLIASYGIQLHFQLHTILQEIKTFIDSFDNSLKYAAAKRFITRIISENLSQVVSIQEALALTWLAIHDDTKRQGLLHDAQAQFVEGLYEIQRGYNLNCKGEDLGGRDKPICFSGTLNKIMEKLHGLHSDVAIYYINQATATFKFPKIVQAHAMCYLQNFAYPKTLAEFDFITNLLANIEAEKSLGVIKDAIKARVKTELWDEFKEAYEDNQLHPGFLSLLEQIEYVEAPDVSALSKKIQALPEYKHYHEKRLSINFYQQNMMMRLTHHSWWSNRSNNAESQRAFDQKFGLIIRP